MTTSDDGVVAPSLVEGEWARVGWEVGRDVAAPVADEVDRDARVPREAIEAMRQRGLLSMLLPRDAGGGEAGVAEAAQVARVLAGHCASSALVFAMHSIEAYNLRRHGTSSPLRDLAREAAADGLLIANANSEVGVGGDVSRSIAAVDTTTTSWTLDKACLAISYAEASDLIFASARRDEDAAETDQVFVALRRGDCRLETQSGWDTLGLRGTCSQGYRLSGPVARGSVFPVPFATIANDGGGQVRQLLLSAVWVGLADAALARAHAFVQAAARKAVGTVPPGALRVAEIAERVQGARALLVAAAERFASLEAAGQLENLPFQMSLRTLKVATSSAAVEAATRALEVCGIVGFKRDSPFSMDRIVRDAHGGLVMVSNDRYLQDNARTLLVAKHL